jgi:hypothetical protein
VPWLLLNRKSAPRYQVYAYQAGDKCKIPKEMRASESAKITRVSSQWKEIQKASFSMTIKTYFTFKATSSSALPSTAALYTLAKAPVPGDPLM